MNLLKISRETFFIRMKNNSWTAPEKQLISLFYNVEVEVLFPETEECHD